MTHEHTHEHSPEHGHEHTHEHGHEHGHGHAQDQASGVAAHSGHLGPFAGPAGLWIGVFLLWVLGTGIVLALFLLIRPAPLIEWFKGLSGQ